MKNRLVSLCVLFALVSMVAMAADVTGTWKGEAPANGKGGPPTFTFKQTGSTLTGTTTGRGGEIEISNAKIEGENISFEVTRDMGDKGKVTAKYSGKVSGDTMNLKVDRGRGDPVDLTLKKQ